MKEEAEVRSRDQIMVDLNGHVQKCGFFLWAIGAELDRFLLKKDVEQGIGELV